MIPNDKIPSSKALALASRCIAAFEANTVEYLVGRLFATAREIDRQMEAADPAAWRAEWADPHQLEAIAAERRVAEDERLGICPEPREEEER